MLQPVFATDVVDQYIDFATYSGFVCRGGFCTRKEKMLAYVTGERWVLPTARFHDFCRRHNITAMRAMAFAQGRWYQNREARGRLSDFSDWLEEGDGAMAAGARHARRIYAPRRVQWIGLD